MSIKLEHVHEPPIFPLNLFNPSPLSQTNDQQRNGTWDMEEGIEVDVSADLDMDVEVAEQNVWF